MNLIKYLVLAAWARTVQLVSWLAAATTMVAVTRWRRWIGVDRIQREHRSGLSDVLSPEQMRAFDACVFWSDVPRDVLLLIATHIPLPQPLAEHLFPMTGMLCRYQNGVLHSDNGPAIVTPDELVYYANGKLHRLDGPAVISSSGLEWYVNGVRERRGGPAEILADGTVRHWRNSRAVKPAAPAATTTKRRKAKETA